MMSNIVTVCHQGYAQQLQESERRLAELMKVECRLRHQRREATQQGDLLLHDTDSQQGEFPLYVMLHS